MASKQTNSGATTGYETELWEPQAAGARLDGVIGENLKAFGGGP